MIKIYHNPRCSKSRECLLHFNTIGQPFEIVKYMDGITESELRSIIDKLKIKPVELVRQKEAVWVSDYKGRNLTDDEIIHAMLLHPILIERPIVINGEKAVIARPLEKVSVII